MGPPLCTRGKRTGYVDLRHVLFGDHTFGKFRRRSWLRLGCDLLRFVAICWLFVAICWFFVPPSNAPSNARSGTSSMILVLSSSSHQRLADPGEFAFAFVLPFMDFLVTPIRHSSSIFIGGSPRNSRNYRDDRLARLLGYRTIELMYRIVVLSPCQPGNLGGMRWQPIRHFRLDSK